MRRIDRDRSQQRIYFTLAVVIQKIRSISIQLIQLENANAVFGQRGTQAVIPCRVLRGHKLVGPLDYEFQLLLRREAIRTWRRVAILNAL